MSNRELAKMLIDQIPESKIVYVLSFLQGAAIPEEEPNAETEAAIQEARDIMAGKIDAKTYPTVRALFDELDAEEA